VKRVLLDQGIAPRVAGILRSEGWEARHVSEVGMDRADDTEILDFAREREMACVTPDHDFHAHLDLVRPSSPSVVLVRSEGLSADRQAELIKAVWEACGDAIDAGAAVSTDGVTVRLHRLPLK